MTRSFIRRVASLITLRQLEAVSIATTTAAFALTLVLVHGGGAVEANPVANTLIGAGGWTLAGVLAVTGEAAIFAGYRRYVAAEWPRAAMAGGALVAMVGIADIGLNIWLLGRLGLPETVWWAQVAQQSGIVAFAGAAAFGAGSLRRPSIEPHHFHRLSTALPSRRRSLATAATALLVCSAAFSGVGPLDRASPVEPAAADHFATEDYIYYSDQEGVVRKIDPETGNEVDTVSAGTSDIIVTEEWIYTSGAEKIDPADMTISDSNGGVSGGAITLSDDGSRLYVLSDSTVYELNATDMSQTDSTSWGNADTTGTAIGYLDGSVYAVDQWNNVLHKFDTDPLSEVATYSDSDTWWGDVKGHDGHVYLANQSNLLKFNPDLSIADTTSASSDSIRHSLTFTDEKIYAGGTGGHAIQVDQSTFSVEKELMLNDDSQVYGVWSAGKDSPVYAGDLGNTDRPSKFYIINAEMTSYDTYDHQPDTSNILAVEGYAPSASTSGSDLSGNTSTQSGAPISNATVVAYGSNKPDLEQARDQLATLANPTPPKVAQRLDGLQLLGEGGKLHQSESRYALAYSPEDMATPKWIENAPGASGTADLSEPQIRNVDADESVLFVIGDASKSDGLLEGPHNRQVPGKLESGTVVVERIGPTNETLNRLTLETNRTAADAGSIPFVSDSSTVSYARAERLTPGFYRYKPQGGSVWSLMQVGSNKAIIDQYQTDFEGQATAAAQRIQDAISNGTVVTRTTTTNASGAYSMNFPDGVKVVHVQAYKAPAISDDIDLKNVTTQKIRERYSEGDIPEASVYLPARPRRVNIPSQDTDLTLVELTWPPDGNLSDYQSRLNKLEQRLQTSIQNQLEKRLPAEVNATLEELRTRYRTLASLVRANPVLREAYLEFSDRDEIPTADDLSEADLRDAIATLNRALAATSSTGEITPEPPDLSEETLTQQWTLTGFDLADANTSVVAHWSNGTTTEVPEEYVSINPDALTDGGVISVEDYPLGTASASAVNFEVVVAAESGYATGQQQVTNPSFEGTLPALQAIRLDSLEPGPDDVVEAAYQPTTDSSFRRITTTTVYGPDGTELDTTVEDGDTVTFTTSGAGTHTIKATIETTDGHEFVSTTRVSAAQTNVQRPPSLRAKSTPLGVIAIAGDGLASGSVDTAGERLEISAQLPDENSAPSRVHVYTDTLTGATSRPVDIQVVRGETQRALNQHVYVDLHAKSLPSGAYTYRVVEGDNQPLPLGGESQYGSVSVRPNGTTISTYTEADGSVTVEPIPSPSLTDQIRWQLNQIQADLGGISPLQAAPARIGATAPTAAAP